MIEGRSIGKHFGRRVVLSGLDIRVGDGEVVAIMGPNGAGKTTLLRILSTLVRPSNGDVLLDGKSVLEEPVLARRSIGMIGHSTYTYDDLTALENLRFYAAMNSVPMGGFDARAKAMLERVGLAHRMNDRAQVFSRGMRQRLAIARALIHSPRVLLLDEPFSSLDQKGADILTRVLAEEKSDGCSVLLVAHDAARVSAVADRADILVGGKITDSFDSGAMRKGVLEERYRASLEGGIA